MMGRPVAGHLIAGGHKLFVHDHKSAPQELIDKGAMDCADGREVVQRSEVMKAVPWPHSCHRESEADA
jgi:2-hydroxy-3-oxopropionate reductase